MLPYLGGLISVWHGGAIHGGDPKVIKNIAWTLPFTVCAYIACPLWAVPFTALCYLKTLGHGRGFRLSEPMKEDSEPDSIEFLLRGLYGRIPLYWYKVLIMALTGLAAVSGGVVAFGVVDPVAGLLIAVGGLFKGVNAMIFDQNTRAREFADGVSAYTALNTAIWSII